LALFPGPSQKPRLQHARNQQFANGPKTRHLCDKDDFTSRAVFGYLPRNLLRINVFGAKSVFFNTPQIRVTYNMYHWRIEKKDVFFEVTVFRAP